MRRHFLLLLVGALPVPAFASDFRGAWPLLFIQATILLWPLILPLFYVRSAQSRARMYLFLVIMAFGILGLVELPWAILAGVQAWHPLQLGVDLQLLVFIQNLVAFVFCLYYLPRLKGLQLL